VRDNATAVMSNDNEGEIRGSQKSGKSMNNCFLALRRVLEALSCKKRDKRVDYLWV